MSLLTLVQQVARRIGIPSPAGVASSQDQQIVQLMALANEEGQELAARPGAGWQALQNEATFTTVATESQGAITDLADADFKYILNNIMWNRTLLRPVYGPLGPQDWQALKARNVNGPFNQYRMRGNQVLFMPAPTAGETIAFEWVSKNWVTTSTGTSSCWTADSDTGLLDEQIMTQGVIWRWKAAKGLEYSEDFNKYEGLVVDAIGRDGGKSTLNLGGSMDSYQPAILVGAGSWNV